MINQKNVSPDLVSPMRGPIIYQIRVLHYQGIVRCSSVRLTQRALVFVAWAARLPTLQHLSYDTGSLVNVALAQRVSIDGHSSYKRIVR
jgi:hypothetical protein